MARILSGPLRGARWVVGSSSHGCWLGWYERENQRFFRDVLRSGDLVVDVGANVGYFTLLAARLVGSRGRVIAVEPLGRNLAALRRNLALNDVNNVEIVEAALAERAGQARFGYVDSSSCARFCENGPDVVRVSTLDGILESGASKAPRLVKIDVEGAEARVLRGGQLTLGSGTAPNLLVATHGWEAHQDCKALLESYSLSPVEAEIDDASGDGRVLYRAPGERE